MKNITACYDHMVDLVEIETTDGTGRPHSVTYIYAGDDKVGIILDGITKYFTVRGVRAATIKPTKTGISIHMGSSVISWARHCSDDDALWLAVEAHQSTKPYAHQVFSDDVIEHCPWLENGWSRAAWYRSLRYSENIA